MKKNIANMFMIGQRCPMCGTGEHVIPVRNGSAHGHSGPFETPGTSQGFESTLYCTECECEYHVEVTARYVPRSEQVVAVGSWVGDLRKGVGIWSKTQKKFITDK